MVLHCENLDLIWLNEKVESVRKTLHQIAANTCLKNPPTFWVLADLIRCKINRVEKLLTERIHLLLVKAGGLDQFSLGFRVENQEHPIARLAACITSS